MPLKASFVTSISITGSDTDSDTSFGTLFDLLWICVVSLFDVASAIFDALASNEIFSCLSEASVAFDAAYIVTVSHSFDFGSSCLIRRNHFS